MATGSDCAFLAGLAGNCGEAQGTDDWTGINADLEELVERPSPWRRLRLFLIMTPAAAKDLAVRGLLNGVDSLRWNGGSYAGVEILVSDVRRLEGSPWWTRPGLWFCLAISSLGAQRSGVWSKWWIVRAKPRCLSTVQVVVSMCQTDRRCLLAERSIAVKAIRGTAWAHLTGVQLGGGFDSPMSS